LFWRRKNQRLQSRISGVIEASERARDSFQPKPLRVVIDTSYLEQVQAAADADEGYTPADEPPRDAAYGELIEEADAIAARAEAQTDPALSADDTANHTAGELEAWRQFEAMRRDAEAQLEEAAEYIAQANEREIAALKAAEIANKTVARLEADLARAEASRHDAEARAAAAQASFAKSADSAAAKLEAKLAREQAARREAEAGITAANEMIESLRADFTREQAARREAQAKAEAVASASAETARSEVASLEDALARAEAARSKADARAENADRRAAEAERQLAGLRTSSEKHEQAARGEADARARETAALAEAAEQRALVAHLEATLQQVRATQRELEAEVDALAGRAAAAEHELFALREAPAEPAGPTVSDATAELRDLVAELDAALGKEQAARRAIEFERDQALARIAAVEAELTALRAAPTTELKQPHSAPPEPAQAPKPAPAPAPSQVDGSVPPSKVPLRARVEAPAEPEKEGSASAKSADAAQKRRDRRVGSRLPASLWREGLLEPIACTIRDQSSSGAQLQLGPGAFGNEITEFNVGDQFTLTIGSLRDRSCVSCIVMWTEERRCGVKYNGQFHSYVSKPKKGAKGGATAPNIPVAPASKPKFGTTHPLKAQGRR
jgi:hypothetical protein